jgi:hypothetical protein
LLSWLLCAVSAHKRRHWQGSEAMLADSQWRRIFIHIVFQTGLRLEGVCGHRIMAAACLSEKATRSVCSELPNGVRRAGTRYQDGHVEWRMLLCFARSFMRANSQFAFLDSRMSALWVWRGPSLTSSSTLSTSQHTIFYAISTRKVYKNPP